MEGAAFGMMRLMRSWVNLLGRAVLILAITAPLACQRPKATPLSERFESVSEEAREDVLAVRLRELAVEFAARVEETADDIIEATDDEAMRRNALLWKMNAIPASRLALLRIEAVVGFINGWILCEQMRVYFETGPGRDLFGEHQAMAIATGRRLEDRIVDVAASIARDETVLEEWKGRVAGWAGEDPLDDLHFETHASWVTDYADIIKDELSVVESIISIEALAIDVAQRMNIYVADLPRQARWQVEYAMSELLGSERMRAIEDHVAKLESLESLDRIDDISTALEDVGTRLDRLTEVVDRVPQIVANERVQAVESLRAEIEAALQVVREERLAIQATIKSERAAALVEIDRQRGETMEVLAEVVTEQRSLLIAEIDRMTSRSMEAAESQLERVVDHAFIRLVELLAALALVAGIVLFVRRGIARAS
jgi:hypothetical protein